MEGMKDRKKSTLASREKVQRKNLKIKKQEWKKEVGESYQTKSLKKKTNQKKKYKWEAFICELCISALYIHRFNQTQTTKYTSKR